MNITKKKQLLKLLKQYNYSKSNLRTRHLREGNEPLDPTDGEEFWKQAEVPKQKIFSKMSTSQIKQFLKYMVDYINEEHETTVSNKWVRRFENAIIKEFGGKNNGIPNPFAFDAQEVAQYLAGCDFGQFGDYSMTQVNDARWTQYLNANIQDGLVKGESPIRRQLDNWSKETGIEL